MSIHEQILKAYLSWTFHVQSQVPHRVEEVVIDNLSGVHLKEPVFTESQVDEIFLKALSDNNPLPVQALLKVRQSLSFRRVKDEKPNLQNLLETGAIFTDVTDEDIEWLRSKVVSAAPEISTASVLDFIKDVTLPVLRALETYSDVPKSLPCEVLLSEEASGFDAKVMTDLTGRVICSLPKDAKVGIGLAVISIHEIVGHALHFSFLQTNRELKEKFPYLLCLCLHTHESFFLEGIAQFLALLALERGRSIPYQTEILGHTYGWMLNMALAHANIMAILKGERTFEEAVKYHVKCDNSGRRSAEATMSRYKDAMKDVFSCKTTLNYYSSFKAMQPLLRADEARLKRILTPLLTSYFTPAELTEFAIQSKTL